MIRAIQRLAEENGGVSVGREGFVAETGFRQSLREGGPTSAVDTQAPQSMDGEMDEKHPK